jgi:hypothetical protein
MSIKDNIIDKDIDRDNIFEEDNLNINQMFEIHYNLMGLFENLENTTLNIDLPEENDFGFIEYKRNLNTYKLKYSKLKTQIYWRMSEGLTYNSQSSCYYIIGIEDNGIITHSISQEEILNTLEIINKCINNSDIKYMHRTVTYKNNQLLIIKFWKEEILSNNDIRIILLGPSESGKTKFFIGLHNCKFSTYESQLQMSKIDNKIFKSNIYDVHTDENKLKKTLILHHQYFNVKYNKDINLIDSNNFKDIHNNIDITEEEEGLNIHVIDTPGNSIISNVKYLISYNVDIIIHFNHINNLYSDILQEINSKYNNVVNITDTTFLTDFDTKKLLHNVLLKYQSRKKILNNTDDISNILLINESRFIQSSLQTKFNKYIFYSYNLMNINIFDKISDVYVRNIQYKYNYKSTIYSNNSISLETNGHIHKPILGMTKQLEVLDLTNIINVTNYKFEESESLLTYYIIILNQIYIVNSKSIPRKIIFDKIILVPEKYKILPIFIIWCKNEIYYLKIFNIIQ